MKIILSRFIVSKDLSVFSKKFEDPYSLLIICKLFFPHAFTYPQPGSRNNIDDYASSGRAVQFNYTVNRNQDTLARLVEMALPNDDNVE